MRECEDENIQNGEEGHKKPLKLPLLPPKLPNKGHLMLFKVCTSIFKLDKKSSEKIMEEEIDENDTDSLDGGNLRDSDSESVEDDDDDDEKALDQKNDTGDDISIWGGCVWTFDDIYGNQQVI